MSLVTHSQNLKESVPHKVSQVSSVKGKRLRISGLKGSRFQEGMLSNMREGESRQEKTCAPSRILLNQSYTGSNEECFFLQNLSGAALTSTTKLAHVRMKSSTLRGDRRYAVGLRRKPYATICDKEKSG